MNDPYEQAITPPAPPNVTVIADVTMTEKEYERIAVKHPLKIGRMERDLRWLSRTVAKERRKRSR